MQNIIELAEQVSPRLAQDLEEVLHQQQRVMTMGLEEGTQTQGVEREDAVAALRRRVQVAQGDVDDVLRRLQREVASD